MKENNLFAPLSKIPFTTAGSRMILNTTPGGNDTLGYGKLMLGSNHSGGVNRKCRFFRVQLTYKGRLIPCAYVSTPTELRMESDYGCVKFCFPEPHLLCFKSEGEVGLRIFGPMGPQHESCRNMLDGTWQICWAAMNNWLFVPIKGKFTMDSPYDFVGTQSKYVCADWESENGEPFEAIIEESELYMHRRESYPSYEDGLAASTAAFQTFLDDTCPANPLVDEKFRVLSAWITWVHLVYPEKHTRYEYHMFRSQQECLPFAMAWHQYYHACTFRKDKAFAWSLMKSLFAHTREDGQLPDSVTDYLVKYQGCKPPIHGFTFLWLMEHSDVFEDADEDVAWLAERLEKSLAWWTDTHDLDGNGIPEYQHSDECGLDDSSAFKEPPIESPDLMAYLILGFEAVAKMRAMLGQQDVADAAMAKSKMLLDYLVNNMWDGEKFCARDVSRDSVVDSWSIMMYFPTILGERLPEHIREKMCADLMNEDMYLSPYGIRSESKSSFDFAGLWTLGAVIPPIQFIIGLGLEACGHSDYAAEVAKRYMDYLMEYGFDIGDCTDSRLWLKNLWCAWTSSISLFLSTYYIK